MRIFLTGFMGSGKSFNGKKLARLTGRPFVDLDQMIELRAGKTISEIFRQSGEDEFRRLEAATLRDLHRLDFFVLATGGGAPCFHDNMRWMNDNGYTIFLDPPVAVLISRLQSERDHRPLLANDSDLEAVINNKLGPRRHFYEQASITITEAGPQVDIAALIARQLPAHFPP